jgi:hypothetical protein
MTNACSPACLAHSGEPLGETARRRDRMFRPGIARAVPPLPGDFGILPLHFPVVVFGAGFDDLDFFGGGAVELVDNIFCAILLRAFP